MMSFAVAQEWYAVTTVSYSIPSSIISCILYAQTVPCKYNLLSILYAQNGSLIKYNQLHTRCTHDSIKYTPAAYWYAQTDTVYYLKTLLESSRATCRCVAPEALCCSCTAVRKYSGMASTCRTYICTTTHVSHPLNKIINFHQIGVKLKPSLRMCIHEETVLHDNSCSCWCRLIDSSTTMHDSGIDVSQIFAVKILHQGINQLRSLDCIQAHLLTHS